VLVARLIEGMSIEETAGLIGVDAMILSSMFSEIESIFFVRISLPRMPDGRRWLGTPPNSTATFQLTRKTASPSNSNLWRLSRVKAIAFVRLRAECRDARFSRCALG
jgi:hypothetical protein